MSVLKWYEQAAIEIWPLSFTFQELLHGRQRIININILCIGSTAFDVPNLNRERMSWGGDIKVLLNYLNPTSNDKKVSSYVKEALKQRRPTCLSVELPAYCGDCGCTLTYFREFSISYLLYIILFKFHYSMLNLNENLNLNVSLTSLIPITKTHKCLSL